MFLNKQQFSILEWFLKDRVMLNSNDCWKLNILQYIKREHRYLNLIGFAVFWSNKYILCEQKLKLHIAN